MKTLSHSSDSSHAADRWQATVTWLLWTIVIILGWILEDFHTVNSGIMPPHFLVLVGGFSILIFLWLFAFPLGTASLLKRIATYAMTLAGTILLWATASGLFRDPLGPWSDLLSYALAVLQHRLFAGHTDRSAPNLWLVVVFTGATVVISACFNVMVMRLRLTSPARSHLFQLSRVDAASYAKISIAVALMIAFQFWLSDEPMIRSNQEQLQKLTTIALVGCVAFGLTFSVASLVRFPFLKFLLLLAAPLLLIPAAYHYQEFLGTKSEQEWWWLGIGVLVGNGLFALSLWLNNSLPCRLPSGSNDSQETVSADQRIGQASALRLFGWRTAILFLLLMGLAHRLPRHYDVPHLLASNGSIWEARMVAELRDANHGSFFLPRHDRWSTNYRMEFGDNRARPLVESLGTWTGLNYILNLERPLTAIVGPDVKTGDTLPGGFVVHDQSLITNNSELSPMPPVRLPGNSPVRLRIDTQAVDPSKLSLPTPMPAGNTYDSIEMVGGELNQAWLDFLSQVTHQVGLNNCRLSSSTNNLPINFIYLVTSRASLDQLPDHRPIGIDFELLKSFSKEQQRSLLTTRNCSIFGWEEEIIDWVEAQQLPVHVANQHTRSNRASQPWNHRDHIIGHVTVLPDQQ